MHNGGGTFHEMPRSYSSDGGLLRQDLVTFSGAGDRRLERTARLHANVTEVRRQRGNRLEPGPQLESILKAVCDSDGCGAGSLAVSASAPRYVARGGVSPLKCVYYQEKKKKAYQVAKDHNHSKSSQKKTITLQKKNGHRSKMTGNQLVESSDVCGFDQWWPLPPCSALGIQGWTWGGGPPNDYGAWHRCCPPLPVGMMDLTQRFQCKRNNEDGHTGATKLTEKPNFE